MSIALEIPLKRIREELSLSREKLIRRTETVSLGTLRNAECGKRITVRNAQQIHAAINGFLEEAQMSHVSLEDLGLDLY